jgi:hypothetical protein
MNPSKADLALERVHNLYLLQTKLISSLEADLRNADLRKDVRSTIRKFQELLDQVDWRYMGGIDVLESLKQLPGEVNGKMKSMPIAAAKKKSPKKATKTSKKSRR